MKLLHIGLPKSGSTVLQQEIFPELSKILGIEYINLYKNLGIKKNKNFFHILENKVKFDKSLPSEFIISSEALFSKNYQFNTIEKSFEIMKKNFDKNTCILIVLRDPYNFLNSLYIQSIQELNLIDEKDFFINSFQIKKIDNRYNLYNFDYMRLINLYKSYFNMVIVEKYENLNELLFVRQLFKIENTTYKKLKIKFKKKKWNKSLSKTAVKTIFFLNNLYPVKKIDEFFRHKIVRSDKLLLRIKNKFFSLFLPREIFQNYIDKIPFVYKKYKINRKSIPLDLDIITEKYKKL